MAGNSCQVSVADLVLVHACMHWCVSRSGNHQGRNSFLAVSDTTSCCPTVMAASRIACSVGTGRRSSQRFPAVAFWPYMPVRKSVPSRNVCNLVSERRAEVSIYRSTRFACWSVAQSRILVLDASMVARCDLMCMEARWRVSTCSFDEVRTRAANDPLTIGRALTRSANPEAIARP